MQINILSKRPTHGKPPRYVSIYREKDGRWENGLWSWSPDMKKYVRIASGIVSTILGSGKHKDAIAEAVRWAVGANDPIWIPRNYRGHP